MARRRTPANPPPDSHANLATAQELLGVTFRDTDLLRRALTHPSRSFESGADGQYERLEFLGDSVLGFVMAEHVYHAFPHLEEGPLAKLRAALVSGRTLAQVGGELGLDDVILMGRGADVTGVRALKSVRADVFEAVVGAIYLDAGIDATRAFLLRVFAGRTAPEALALALHDSKSELQERTMATGGLVPDYTIVAEEGPPHARVFTAEVRLGDVLLGAGSGGSKQDAEKAAADRALEALSAAASPDRGPR